MTLKTTVRVLVAALMAVAATGERAAAEERSRTWVGLGLGGGTGSGGGGFALDGTLVHQRRSDYFALRTSLFTDPYREGGNITRENAILYGRSAVRRYGHVALASGLATVTLDPCDGSRRPSRSCTTLGIPLVAEAAVQPLPILGVGIQGFANLNTKGSFAGVGMFLQVGWMPR